MTDSRRHRGQNPRDVQEFASDVWPALRGAVREFSWLLSHEYAEPSALKVVGDHWSLTQRQRLAVMRSSCSDLSLIRRTQTRLDLSQLRGKRVLLDGFNVLITLESALAEGVLLVGRDGCWRDMASQHGTWRRVEETSMAASRLGRFLQLLGVTQCDWYLDAPVSNSGKLKVLLQDLAAEQGWPWSVQNVPNPDRILAASEEVLITSDSDVLDKSAAWVNVFPAVVDDLPLKNLLWLGEPVPE